MVMNAPTLIPNEMTDVHKDSGVLIGQRRIRAWISDLDGTLTILPINWRKMRDEVKLILKTDHPLMPIAASIPQACPDEALRKRAYLFIEGVELGAAAQAVRDPRLVSVVQLAKTCDLAIALVTHQALAPAKLTVEKLGLLPYFSAIVSREDVLDRSQQIILAASSLGVKVEEVLFTGDSSWDVEAGKRLGCFTVCVRERHEGADVYVQSVLELEGLFKR